MTFDELWRANLSEKRIVTNSESNVPDIDLPGARMETDAATDQPSEAEVNRFIEWLEKSILRT